jgi:hypothetical protein
MSYQIGLDAIHLRPTPRLAHTDYCSNDALKRRLGVRSSALGPAEQQFGTKQDHAESGERFEDAWEMDLIWITHDGPGNWAERGRATDMGHGDFLEGGTDRRTARPSPFEDVEQVWAFDAEKEYGVPDSSPTTRRDDTSLPLFVPARGRVRGVPRRTRPRPAFVGRRMNSGADAHQMQGHALQLHHHSPHTATATASRATRLHLWNLPLGAAGPRSV